MLIVGNMKKLLKLGTHIGKSDKIVSTLLESLDYVVFNHRVGEINAKGIFEKVEPRFAATVIPTMDHVRIEVEHEASLARAGLTFHRFKE